MEIIKKNKKIIAIAGFYFILTWVIIFSSQIFYKRGVVETSFIIESRSASFLSAQAKSAAYVPLTSIPGLTDGNKNPGLAAYLGNMYNWGIAVAVVLSVLMIIFGGIQYMTTDAIQNKAGGKDKIYGALFGLILALSSYLILQTINPQLVSLEIAEPGGMEKAASRASENAKQGNTRTLPAWVPVKEPANPEANWTQADYDEFDAKINEIEEQLDAEKEALRPAGERPGGLLFIK